MNALQPAELTRPWQKSSYCDTGGQCVEVAQTKATRLVRDSADPAGPRLTVTEQAWASFIRGIKNGPDHLQAPGR